ncbi:MAG TPA: hypothetical protein VNU68_35280 [Verrucomicrobiae bacterium]|nr:hypothetical protein [Verrucomicrobiae bacterium]
MQPDLLSSLSFSKMENAVETSIQAVSGHRIAVFSKFLAALHANGYCVQPLPEGAVVPVPVERPDE